MDRFKIHKTIGDGAYGIVYKANVIKTGEIVAIKKMKKKFYSWDECMALKELKSLRKLNHQNVIKLKEVAKVNDDLYFIFEHLDKNLLQLYTEAKEKGKSVPETEIRSIIYQAAAGLAYMHKNGYFHRDMKPENLLVSGDVVKIADFGLAREIRSRPPYTEYISTRWYRAPEILLKAPNYNSPVDIFALGCIMAELYLLAPLFNGSSEIDQVYKICSILGAPSPKTWSEGFQLAAKIGLTFPQFNPVPLSTVIPNASSDALLLLGEMLKFDPHKRITANQILQHPFFSGYIPIDKGLSVPEDSVYKNIKPTSREQQNSRGLQAFEKVTEMSDHDHLDAKTHLGTINQMDTSFASNTGSRERNRDLNFGVSKPLDKDVRDILGYGVANTDENKLKIKKNENLNPIKPVFGQNSRQSIPQMPSNGISGIDSNLYGSNQSTLDGRYSNPTNLFHLNPLVLPQKPQIPQVGGYIGYQNKMESGLPQPGFNANSSGKYGQQGGLDSLDFLTKNSGNDHTTMRYRPIQNNANNPMLKMDTNVYNFSNMKPLGSGLPPKSIVPTRQGINDFPFENNGYKSNNDRLGALNPIGERQSNIAPAVGGFDYIGRYKY